MLKKDDDEEVDERWAILHCGCCYCYDGGDDDYEDGAGDDDGVLHPLPNPRPQTPILLLCQDNYLHIHSYSNLLTKLIRHEEVAA
jgi:hypothetical protein